MADSTCATPPSAKQRARWQKLLAEERAEGRIYRQLAAKAAGEEREILNGLADAEARHAAHWEALLGEHVRPTRTPLRVAILGFFARIFGFLFVLALAQRAEERSPYATDADATEQMAADEAIHAEVVRALAARGRARLSGGFRAAIFGMNDGLVSNLALVAGIGAVGVGDTTVLITGVAGLLAGALSMAAGEYVSVQSQRELLGASVPTASAGVVTALDVEANELALVYRARGMSQQEAEQRARAALAAHQAQFDTDTHELPPPGAAWQAAASSFAFFALGALLPILPWLVGAGGTLAMIAAFILVGIALLITGGVVGVLSGSSPLLRATRQLIIGFGAAGATIILGKIFGITLG
ncbi:MAG: VIT1/CCC1 family protein [Bowdeniella nasicola]|nr:VIT1/CCC1 family protein [Bowdeniella nasicola]